MLRPTPGLAVIAEGDLDPPRAAARAAESRKLIDEHAFPPHEARERLDRDLAAVIAALAAQQSVTVAMMGEPRRSREGYRHADSFNRITHLASIQD
jgi:hypothetical protein